jgi:signal transduction histidine kinase/CheY-like chemotaxis protein
MAEAAATLGIVADYLGQELDRRRMETALGRELQIDAALAGLTRALLAPEVDARRSAALVLEEALRLTGSARGAVAGLAGTLRVAPRNAGDPEAAGVGDPALARWGADLPDALVCGGPPAPPEEGEPSRPEGVTRFVAVPVRSAAGRLAHLVVADAPEGYGPRDQRAVEQLAEVLALALQRRIAEDERQALQEQVWEAQKMQGLGTLAGGIAHDFNNILSAVLGFAELSVDRAGGDPELHENLEEIVRACRRAADLVRQILTFGRRTLDERQLLRPHLIVVETLKLLRASLPAAVRIERDIDEDTGPILAHPAQLQQVVMNLCTNAFQAMGERGGTLRVRLRSTAVAPGAAGVPPELRAGRHVVLTVADTGVGMSDETRARIFEPYFTTKPLGEGTGLGLSVVHGVVAALEGAITVESAPGAGAAFRVWLPEQSAAIEAAAEAAPEVPRAGCGRVLLVDDEQTVMTVARHMLGRLGYDVTAFDDPATALAAFAHDPDDWDAVVTDLNMPGIDGIELTTVVRARRRDLPVVLMTGHLDDGARRRLEAAGAVIQVMKPISTGALGHAVQRALAAGSAPEAAAAPSGGRRADSATIRA